MYDSPKEHAIVMLIARKLFLEQEEINFREDSVKMVINFIGEFPVDHLELRELV